MVNKQIIIGRLGKDPEVRTLDNGTKVSNMNVATSESYKDKAGNWQEVTEWHTVISWRGAAEYVSKHLRKGALVYVEGRTKTREYQDKEGITRRVKDVVSTSIQKLEWAKSSNGFDQITEPMTPAQQKDFLKSDIKVAEGIQSEISAAPLKSNFPTAPAADDLPF